jgi:hypothetical protein
MGKGTAPGGTATRRTEVFAMSHEMEMEDFLVDMKRKLAIVEEQNQALREQNSRLTLALDDALSIVRKHRAERETDLQGGYEL